MALVLRLVLSSAQQDKGPSGRTLQKLRPVVRGWQGGTLCNQESRMGDITSHLREAGSEARHRHEESTTEGFEAEDKMKWELCRPAPHTLNANNAVPAPSRGMEKMADGSVPSQLPNLSETVCARTRDGTRTGSRRGLSDQGRFFQFG